MIPFPDKKYQIIYADPPWEYKQSGGVNGSRGMAKTHYATMPTEDLCNLPVDKIAGGGLSASCGQHSQISAKLSRSWRRGASSTRPPLSCGSKPTRKAESRSGEWGPIPEQTPKSACWGSRRDLRPKSRSRAMLSIRSWRPRWVGIVRSRTRCGGGSWSCLGMFPALSFSPEKGPRAGTHGGTRFDGQENRASVELQWPRLRLFCMRNLMKGV